MQSRTYRAVILGCFLHLAISPYNIAFAAETTNPDNDPVYARINERNITLNEFAAIFRNAVRNKFYHGEVPQEELKAFRDQVAKEIIDQVLLQQEAKRLQLEPDHQKIEDGLKAYEARYSRSPGWQPLSEEQRKLMLDRLAQTNIIDQMRTKIRDIPQPDTAAVRRYYESNKDKFTEPRQLSVSVILLPVPPSSLNDAWLEAENVAQSLIDRINDGAAFSDLAQEFSAHASSVNGGDLGYLHQDMLDSEAQSAVDKLQVGELTPPVRVLRGVTIFQLNGVKEQRLNPFELVQQRAADLLYRDLQDQAWVDYLAKLKQASDITINEHLLVDSNEK